MAATTFEMNNFAVLTIDYSPYSDGLSIKITTNNPCHLTCYYTDKEPRRHRTARNQRGLTLPWGVYYCFVSWQSVEQIEPGDTLAHSFEIPGWSYCQTKWFAFRGTVTGLLSPSVSCLFQYHHPGITRWHIRSSGDDTHRRYIINIWSSTGLVNYIGYYGAPFGHSLRFTNIDIAQGTTIKDAHLIYTSNALRDIITVRAEIAGNDIDNAIAPTRMAEYDNMVLTTARIAWTHLPTWEPNKEYTTPSITAILQEIVNRPGWVSGNAIQFRIDDNGSDVNAGRQAYSYDADPTLAPVLNISWR